MTPSRDPISIHYELYATRGFPDQLSSIGNDVGFAKKVIKWWIAAAIAAAAVVFLLIAYFAINTVFFW